jgi:hypothetical protein
MLDVSRRLRMDESRPLFPRQDLCGQIEPNAAPIAAGVQHPAEPDDRVAVPVGDPIDPLSDPIDRLPTGLHHESSTITYCGTEQQVSEGFAIALRAMGTETILPWGIAPDTTIPNREDT